VLPIKTILCPTDFSDSSYEALSAACELAEHFDAELTVMHVVSPIPTIAANVGPSAFNINTYRFELENDSKEVLTGIISEKVPKGVTVHPYITYGNPAEKILQKAAEKGKVDMIVIASHGRTGWRDIVFGSVAERVVRLSAVPVLTISGKKKQ
jgi:universal stress protein A